MNRSLEQFVYYGRVNQMLCYFAVYIKTCYLHKLINLSRFADITGMNEKNKLNEVQAYMCPYIYLFVVAANDGTSFSEPIYSSIKTIKKNLKRIDKYANENTKPYNLRTL